MSDYSDERKILLQYERTLIKSQSGGRFSDYESDVLLEAEAQLLDGLRAKSQLATLREQIAEVRDLLRTGTPPKDYDFSTEVWHHDKIIRAAGKLTKLLAELEEK